MKSDQDKINLKEWLAHMQQWILTCPIFEEYPHTYVRSLGKKEMQCLICGKVTIADDEDDEDIQNELELDEKFSQFMRETEIK